MWNILLIIVIIILQGLPDPINSAFHLTYNMVLNLLRVDEINPEYMLERSFFQFQNYSVIPQLYESEFLYTIQNKNFCVVNILLFCSECFLFFSLEIKTLQEKHSSIEIENEDDVDVYYKIKKQLAVLTEEYRTYIIQPEYCVPFLQTGRLIKVNTFFLKKNK